MEPIDKFYMLHCLRIIVVAVSAGLSALTPRLLPAQDKRVKISLIVKDSLTANPVESATVAVYRSQAKNIYKYGVSNASGVAQIQDIPLGDYRIKIDMMGYLSQERMVSVKGDKNPLFLGEVMLKEDVTYLESIVVSALGNPIVAKKDTIEYNAGSFHTTENSTLKDLLQKLPGVEIDADGSITVNGQDITKVMIEGKEFFSDNPQIATENLPAKIIEKVRVVDRKSDQARFTGIEDGEEEKVLDLSLHKGMMNGFFGNVSGGYGTDNRYQGGGILAKITETSQLSLLANLNNTNNRGFRDIAGNMMQNMRVSGPGFRGGGMGGMWGRNEGITTSYMGGLTGAKDINDKLKLDGNYMYGRSEKLQEQKIERENILPDRNFFYNQDKSSLAVSDGHNAGLNVEYKWNERNQLVFRPRVNIGYGSFEDKSSYESHYPAGDSINRGLSIANGKNNSQQTNGNLTYSHRFKKAGNTLTIGFNYSYSNNEIKGLNRSETHLFGSAEDGSDGVSMVDQRYDQQSLSYSLRGRSSFTFPVAERRYLEANYSYRYNKGTAIKNAYDYNASTERYDIPDPDYTNDFKNIFIRQQIGINYRSNQEKYRLTLGFNVQPTYTRSYGDVGKVNRDYTHSVVNYAPNAQFEYNFSENSFLRMDYWGRTEQPSIDRLAPVPDNSNPTLIKLGNPDLGPEFQHRMRVNFMDTKMETFRTLFGRLDATYTMNHIVNKSWYTDDGIRYTQPVNEGSALSLNGSFMYNAPIARSKFYIGNSLMIRYSKGSSYSNAVLNRIDNTGVYETLRFTYRGDNLNARISGRFGLSKAWYSLETSPNSTTWNNNVEVSIDWTTPWWGLSLETDFSYKYYLGYGENYNQDAMIWNGSIEKNLFKNKAVLALKAYDILNQAITIRRNTTDSFIEDTENNTLRQYFMLSFTYRFGTFGGQNSGRRSMYGGRRGFRGGPNF